jgi:hypothetical protein
MHLQCSFMSPRGVRVCFFFVVVEEIAYVYAGSPPPHPTPSGGKNTCVAFGHSSAATRTEIPPVNTINRFRPLQLFWVFFIEYVPVGISAASSDILAVARTQRSTSCGLWRRPSPRARPGNAVSSPRAQANRIRVTVIGIQSFAHSFLNWPCG